MPASARMAHGGAGRPARFIRFASRGRSAGRISLSCLGGSYWPDPESPSPAPRSLATTLGWRPRRLAPAHDTRGRTRNAELPTVTDEAVDDGERRNVGDA